MAAAIEAIVFAGAAGFAVIVVATILVIIGVRQEEHFLNGRVDEQGRRRFEYREPPTILALLARQILRAQFHPIPDQLSQRLDDPDDEPPWYERPPVGPRVR
jgi:hypothetical protein